MKRAGANGGGADPRSEGAPSRARNKLRSEFFRRAEGDTAAADDPTGELPADPETIDPTPPTAAVFDWVDTDTGVQSAVTAPPLAPADDDVTRVGPIVPAVRTTTVVNDIPEPATPTGVVPLVVRPAEAPPAPPEVSRPLTSPTIVGRRSRARVRRVRRVVRSIDTWTVFKVSVLFYLVLYAILMVAGVLLWNVAYATGTIDNLEHFFESFGWESFRFHGGEIFHASWIAGLFLVAAGTGLNVVAATVFNLMADLVGGIGVTVLEEEVRVVPDTEVGRRRS